MLEDLERQLGHGCWEVSVTEPPNSCYVERGILMSYRLQKESLQSRLSGWTSLIVILVVTVTLFTIGTLARSW